MSVSGIVNTKVERDYASFCKRCGVILRFNNNDIKVSCYEAGRYYDCVLTYNQECFDHPTVLYIECQNKHRVHVGNPRNLFYGGRLDAIYLFCLRCERNDCVCLASTNT